MTPTPNTSWGGTRRSYPTPLRNLILTRANHRCEINGPTCTETATEADHIVPWSQGGTDTLDNGQAVCPACHKLKTEHERRFGQARHSRKRNPIKHPGLPG